jgi:hypothetical protein
MKMKKKPHVILGMYEFEKYNAQTVWSLINSNYNLEYKFCCVCAIIIIK